MKKLIILPSDPIEDYVKEGFTYEYYEAYFNPGYYFDEVYALSPWGDKNEEKIGNMTYLKAKPNDFKNIIRQIAPDVVRAYGGYYCSDWATMNKVPGIPVVVSVHDTNPVIIHKSMAYADEIICMAECVKDAVLKHTAAKPENVCVMPNRIDTNLFKKTEDAAFFKSQNEKYGSGKHILHVGRLHEQKNQDTLIRALPDIDPEAKVLFLGRGDATPYKQLAENLHVADRCIFIEAVPNRELPLWHSWCDCFCTPSRWEGFGYVFIEAAACEAGVVTSDIAPMNEYLTNEKTAILISNHEDPKEIAQAVNRVLAGGEDIDRMRRAAREVGMAFEKSVIDEKEIAIYERVMKKGCVTGNMPLLEKWKLRNLYRKRYGS